MRGGPLHLARLARRTSSPAQLEAPAAGLRQPPSSRPSVGEQRRLAVPSMADERVGRLTGGDHSGCRCAKPLKIDPRPRAEPSYGSSGGRQHEEHPEQLDAPGAPPLMPAKPPTNLEPGPRVFGADVTIVEAGTRWPHRSGLAPREDCLSDNLRAECVRFRALPPLGARGLIAPNQMIAQARRRGSEPPVAAEHLLGDARCLELADDSFHLCRAERVLRCIDQPGQALRDGAGGASPVAQPLPTTAEAPTRAPWRS